MGPFLLFLIQPVCSINFLLSTALAQSQKLLYLSFKFSFKFFLISFLHVFKKSKRNLEVFNLVSKYLGVFQGTFLLLTSNLISVVKGHTLYESLWPKILAVLVNVAFALKKNVYFAAGIGVFYKYQSGLIQIYYIPGFCLLVLSVIKRSILSVLDLSIFQLYQFLLHAFFGALSQDCYDFLMN